MRGVQQGVAGPDGVVEGVLSKRAPLMLRLFVAIEVNEQLRSRLAEKIDACRKLAPKARWTPPEKLHLTLAFLGSMDEAKVPGVCAALNGACARHSPFELSVGRGGSFGRASRPKVLWAGVCGDEPALQRFFSDVAVALAPFGYKKESRGFHPHVTLARARDLRGDRALAACVAVLGTLDAVAMHVPEVVLIKSTGGTGGSKYGVLHRAALAASTT